MSEHNDDGWSDERHGFRLSGSLTELYATSANTLDRIRREMDEGELAKVPLRGIILVALDGDGNVTLFQSGSVHELIWMATQAAEQAVMVAQESGLIDEEAHDEETQT